MGKRTNKYTTSMVKCFKQCRKKYELEYIEMLRPVQTPKALELGTLYHRGIEYLLSGVDIDTATNNLIIDQKATCEINGVDFDPIPVGIACEMVRAFDRESNWKSWNIRQVEKEFEVSIGYGKRLIGKIDAIMEHEDRTYLIEHKTTSIWNGDGSEYLHNLLWDEQSTNYLMAHQKMLEDGTISGNSASGIFYCIVEKPSLRPLLATPIEKRRYKQDGTIYGNQREQDETPEEYLERVKAWFAERPRVHTHFVYRTPKQLTEQIDDLNLVFRDMIEAERSATYYRNPAACSILECPYRPKCLENTPDTDCLFTHKTKRNEELNG